MLSMGILLASGAVGATAQENVPFRLSLQSRYQVQQNGTTRITNTVEIRNTSPTQYLSEYALTVQNDNVSNPSVTVGDTAVTPEVITAAENTSIRFDLPEVVAGTGKSQTISISYNAADAAIITGNALSVYVPRVADYERYDSYDVILETPSRYGGPSRTTPTAVSWQEIGERIVTTFQPAVGESIAAVFGTDQYYALDLSYELYNSSGQQSLAQIALPPDTSYQRVQYTDISPEPMSIERDIDGNWIATYELTSDAIASISAQALVHVSLEPHSQVPVVGPTPAHTEQKPFWELGTSEIPTFISDAQDVSTPRGIYDFTVDTLDYSTARLEQDRLERLGARGALQNPDAAVCQEYTDVFVALARKSGIPARRITGFAYTENEQLRPLSLVQDVLHAWPEYWDQSNKRWTPIDPTWADTTGGVNYFDQFDLNHVVFAINGVSSTQPLPAGSYRSSDQPKKQIDVTFADSFQLDPTPPKISLQPRQILGIEIPGLYTAILDNPTGRAWYDLEIRVDQASFQTDHLLPQQTIMVPVKVEEPGTHRSTVVLAHETATGSAIIEQYDVTLTGLPSFIRDGYELIQRIPISRETLISVGIGLVLAPLGAGSILVLKRRR